MSWDQISNIILTVGPDRLHGPDRLLPVADDEADAQDQAAGDQARLRPARSSGTRSPAPTRPRPSCRRSSTSCATRQRFQRARRQGPEGHPAARPARHRQDAAGQGRGQRVRRPVLRAVGGQLRRDVRRPRRRADPAAVRRGPQALAGDRLHRRDRRRRRPPRLRQQLRARADAQPAAGRDGRLLVLGRDRGHRRVQPAREARSRRCCAPAASTARSSSRRPTSAAARRS